MGSVYANIVNKIREDNDTAWAKNYSNPPTIKDIEEADLYYFVVKSGNTIIAEGELPTMKLKLPDEYFNKPIKKFYRDKVTMTAYVEF